MSSSLLAVVIALLPNLASGRAGMAADLQAVPVEEPELGIEDEEGEDDGLLEDDVETPVRTGTVATSSAARATAELDDATLLRLWKEDRAALGSIAIGLPTAGRLINAEPFPQDPRWVIIDPPNTFATRETIGYMTAAVAVVHERFPDSPPLRINHISAQEGGYLPPHSTHQLGRDVDLGFYRSETRAFDVERNWALLRALITHTDLELVLVDRRIQRVMYEYAASIGEDRAWLDSIFRDGNASIVRHARRHRDHFHVRFYNPRAQELGRRLQPHLGEDEKAPQLVRHRIRPGDSLSRIAVKYGVSISALKRANRMRSDFLRAGRALAIPVRGRCIRCPVAPEVVLPPRRLPPEPAQPT